MRKTEIIKMALASSAIMSAMQLSANAQEVNGNAVASLTPGCPIAFLPNQQISCDSSVFTSESVDAVAPIVNIVSPQLSVITINRDITFSGNINLYGTPTENDITFGSGSAYYGPVVSTSGDLSYLQFNPDYQSGLQGIQISASGSYNVSGDVLSVAPFAPANPARSNYASSDLVISNQTINVDSIYLNSRGYFTDNEGVTYDAKFSSSGVVSGNATDVTGTFSHNAEGDALVFGKISGTAEVVASSSPISDANGREAISPYQMNLSLSTQVTTKLDENGLITPTVAVTDGIEMGGSKITNLAAGSQAGDAVNYEQLSALATEISVTNSNVSTLATGLSTTNSNVATLSARLSNITSAQGPLVLGSQSSATGTGAVALGFRQVASGNGAVALGDPNTATGTGAIAIGAENSATGNGAVALGNANTASGNGSVAIGNASTASQNGAVALGNGASATGANSVALGSGSVATVENTVSVGSSSTARKVVYVAAGNVAAGSTDAVNGGQLYSLTARVNDLESFTRDTRGEARSGIAAAMAMANAPMPSAPGRTAWSFNLANFKDAQAGSFAMTHRFDTENPFALSGAVSYSGSDVGVRVGLSGEF